MQLFRFYDPANEFYNLNKYNENLTKSGGNPEPDCCVRYGGCLKSASNTLYRTETHVNNGALFFATIYAYERGKWEYFWLFKEGVKFNKKKRRRKREKIRTF